MSLIQLDKLILIGGIHDKTPICIIRDIALSYGMDDNYIHSKPIEMIISEIRKIKKIEINIDNDEDLGVLARFINCEETWSAFSLMRAYLHLIEFDLSTFQYEGNVFGPKTSEHPKSIDLILTYRLCQYFSIAMTRNTTFEDMVFRLRSGSFYFRSTISSQEESNDESLEEFNSFLMTSEDKIYRFLNPRNGVQSILFAAKAYDVDISLSKFPLNEYHTLAQQGTYAFIPYDESFRKKFRINPSFFNIRERYNPKFDFLYTPKDKIKFASDEGYKEIRFHSNKEYTHSEGEKATNFLMSVYSDNNFYPGKHPFSEGRTPIELEEIEFLDESSVVSYGTYVSAGGECSFQTFKFDELCDFFSYRKNFCNPLNEKKLFSEREITKLLILCSTSFNPAAKRLKECILQIRNSIRSLYPEEVELLSLSSRSEENRKLSISLLRRILEIGMFMRGWKVTSDEYPLKSEETVWGDREAEVSLNVSKALIEFNTLIERSDNKEVLIATLVLPLVEYKSSSFVRSVDVNQGLTIADKLRIIETPDSIYACIRMSSNLLCATSYKYLKTLGENPGFDISLMRHIS